MLKRLAVAQRVAQPRAKVDLGREPGDFAVCEHGEAGQKYRGVPVLPAGGRPPDRTAGGARDLRGCPLAVTATRAAT
ncbi:MAG TPA: hypothetical protein VK387_04370, partial [Thermoleophilaceae bacterium]|nr:hypothetical protein [Thermoleophilaceae bacterium]